MSTQLMLQNNPPDPEVKRAGKSEVVKAAVSFTISSNSILTETGRIQTKRKNISNSPKGLVDIR